jgi:23S rRNA pseudouridine2605 synthase
MEQVRLQKVIAEAGIASRRASEKLILDGRVTVNGKSVTEMGVKINPEIDKVEVDGESITLGKPKLYILFYKPQGVLSTMNDPSGRPNLGDFFEDLLSSHRIYHVGRLDQESEGLLLLTNDGLLAHRATHPSFGLQKKYWVEVEGAITPQAIGSLKEGVELEDGYARADETRILREISPTHQWWELTIHEGRYHVVRRMIATLGLEVLRLIRTDFGPLSIGEMKPGRYRYLNPSEQENLFKTLLIKP